MKKTIIYISIITILSLSIQANDTGIKRGFTVTQIALDAEYNRIAEDSNITVEEIIMQGGVTEEN